MSDLVGNPEDRFSHDAAQLWCHGLRVYSLSDSNGYPHFMSSMACSNKNENQNTPMIMCFKVIKCMVRPCVRDDKPRALVSGYRSCTRTNHIAHLAPCTLCISGYLMLNNNFF